MSASLSAPFCVASISPRASRADNARSRVDSAYTEHAGELRLEREKSARAETRGVVKENQESKLGETRPGGARPPSKKENPDLSRVCLVFRQTENRQTDALSETDRQTDRRCLPRLATRSREQFPLN